MVADGMYRYVEALRRLNGCRVSEHQLGHLLLARCQPERLEQWRDEGRVSGLDKDGHFARARVTEQATTEAEPSAGGGLDRCARISSQRS